MLVTVLFARCYDFTDEKTGKPVRGGELVALPVPTPGTVARNNEKGQKPLTMKMEYSVFAALPTLPAKCELETTLREYQGNASVYVVGVEAVQQAPK